MSSTFPVAANALKTSPLSPTLSRAFALVLRARIIKVFTAVGCEEAALLEAEEGRSGGWVTRGDWSAAGAWDQVAVSRIGGIGEGAASSAGAPRRRVARVEQFSPTTSTSNSLHLFFQQPPSDVSTPIQSGFPSLALHPFDPAFSPPHESSPFPPLSPREPPSPLLPSHPLDRKSVV